MPLDSIGPKTAILSPILGKMLETCQFYEDVLAAKSSLDSESPVFLIQAVWYAHCDDFWFGLQ